MSSVLEKKPLGMKIKQAGQQGDPGSAKDCVNCTKVGLAILPVVSTPALRMLFEKYKDSPTDVQWLKALESRLIAEDRDRSWDFMRALPPGYLYVLKPNNSWDAYVVGGDGLLKRAAVANLDDDPDKVALSKSCAREGHSNINPQ